VVLKSVLPSELIKLCDFSKMELEPTEHIDEELRKLISDVLWRVPLKDGERTLYGYYLMEHESGFKNHDLLPFRFHKYVIRIMQKHLDKGNDKLPIVVPVLLYHGATKGYPHSVSIFDCFESRELAEQYAFRDIKLIDLTAKSDDDLAQYGFRFLFGFVLKWARDEQLAMRLVKLLEKHPELARYFDGKEFKKAFVSLLMSLDLDSEKVASETLKKLDDITGADIMTLREQWEQKAVQKHAPMLKAEGRHLEKVETARELLLMGDSIDKVVLVTKLSKEEVTALADEVNGKKH
uniref:Rpn family recombination-promoting nuclease/putative transposase n=2 Tax=Cysteiniphilum marinum TaxID=2774191 RepID=UPI00193A7032